MHYEYEYEVTDEVRKLVTRNLLELYEECKNDIKVFPQRNEKLQKVTKKQ